MKRNLIRLTPLRRTNGHRVALIVRVYAICLLAEPSYIGFIVVDCAVDRSANFIVGLTDVSPSVTAPTLWNYAVCGQWPGNVPNAATVYLPCNYNLTTLYRYIIVQFPHTEEIVANFCELEVFLHCKMFHVLDSDTIRV